MGTGSAATGSPAASTVFTGSAGFAASATTFFLKNPNMAGDCSRKFFYNQAL
jgi:hypothetical protein